MRDVLFTFTAPGPIALLGIFILLAALVGAWLWWLHRQERFTQEHLYNGVAVLIVSAILMAILHALHVVRVNSYGAMLMLGFLAGTAATSVLGRRRGLTGERVIDLGLVILVGAIVGARLLYVLITKDATGAHPAFLDWNDLRQGLGGLSFHGGLLGGLIAGGIYIRLNKLHFWRVADTAAPAVAVGYAITRIGCFLNGCCFGKPAEGLPWAVQFPKSGLSHLGHLHPSQLYASVMGFTIFGLLLILSRGRSLGRAGRLFLVFVMLEGVERFVMEIYRYPDEFYPGVVTPAQVFSVVLILAAIAGWFFLPKRAAVEGEEPTAGVISPSVVCGVAGFILGGFAGYLLQTNCFASLEIGLVLGGGIGGLVGYGIERTVAAMRQRRLAPALAAMGLLGAIVGVFIGYLCRPVVVTALSALPADARLSPLVVFTRGAALHGDASLLLPLAQQAFDRALGAGIIGLALGLAGGYFLTWMLARREGASTEADRTTVAAG